jgi:hypothetical protein
MAKEETRLEMSAYIVFPFEMIKTSSVEGA